MLLLEVSSAPLTAGSSDLWAICRDDYGIMPGRLKGRLAGRETQVADDTSERMEWCSYPAVIITCVHHLGPPGPFYFPDSRDLLEVLGGLSWQRERDPREDPLGSGRIP